MSEMIKWLLIGIGIGFLGGFFVAANNPDKANRAQWMGGRFLNALRRGAVKCKWVFGWVTDKLFSKKKKRR